MTHFVHKVLIMLWSTYIIIKTFLAVLLVVPLTQVHVTSYY